jgi:hypothetical protein
MKKSVKKKQLESLLSKVSKDKFDLFLRYLKQNDSGTKEILGEIVKHTRKKKIILLYF